MQKNQLNHNTFNYLLNIKQNKINKEMQNKNVLNFLILYFLTKFHTTLSTNIINDVLLTSFWPIIHTFVEVPTADPELYVVRELGEIISKGVIKKVGKVQKSLLNLVQW